MKLKSVSQSNIFTMTCENAQEFHIQINSSNVFFSFLLELAVGLYDRIYLLVKEKSKERQKFPRHKRSICFSFILLYVLHDHKKLRFN